MAGYLSGFVWGGLFTAAGLAVVSELTLPGKVGAVAANSPTPRAETAAPAETASTATAETAVTETTAESATAPDAEETAAAPADPAETAPTATETATTETATTETAPAAATEPAPAETASEAADDDASEVVTETPTATETATAETPANPAETATAATEPAAKTEIAAAESAPAEAAPAATANVDLPPIFSVTADDAKAQLAARQAELAPAVAAEPVAETTAAEAVQPAKPADEAVAAPEAEVTKADTTEPAATETAAAQDTTATHLKTDGDDAEAASMPEMTDAAKAAEAALLGNISPEMGKGDEAELAELGNSRKEATDSSKVVPEITNSIGDGDAAEGYVASDQSALELAVSGDAAPVVPAQPEPPAKEPNQPQAETLAPVAPEAEKAPTELAAAPVVTQLTPLPQADTADAPTLETPPAGETELAASEQATAAPRPQPSKLPQIVATAPADETAEIVADDPAQTPTQELAGSFKPSRLGTGAEGVVTGRLPSIGDDAEEKAAAEAEELSKKPPVERFAQKFENESGAPVVSILLMDNGASPELREQVAELPFPVAVALDPMAPDVAATAALYREKGVELVMLATGLPNGATAADVETTFSTHEQSLPEVVAVMDTAQGTFQNNRPLATLVAPVIKAKGWALITWDKGMNAGDQVAEREQMPKGLIFRQFDEAGSNDTGMRRNLDRAAMKAGQDGGTIVTGTINEQTLRSLVAWALEGKGKTVSLGPVSAALEKPEATAEAGAVAEN